MQTVGRQHRVLVTGVGVVSPLGLDLSSNLRSLVDARDAVARVRNFDVTKTRCKTAAQIPDGCLEDALGRRRSRLHRVPGWRGWLCGKPAIRLRAQHLG